MKPAISCAAYFILFIGIAHAQVSDIVASSGKIYRHLPKGATVGTPAYTDRDYRISSLSKGLAGSDLIQTANSDDVSTHAEHLSFRVDRPGYVFVAYLATAKSLPGWLGRSWELSTEEAEVDILGHPAVYTVYFKAVVAGERITLGGNEAMQTSAMAHYLVLVNPAIAGIPAPQKDTLANLFMLKVRVLNMGQVDLVIHSRSTPRAWSLLRGITIFRAAYPAEDIGYASSEAMHIDSGVSLRDAKPVAALKKASLNQRRTATYTDKDVVRQINLTTRWGPEGWF